MPQECSAFESAVLSLHQFFDSQQLLGLLSLCTQQCFNEQVLRRTVFKMIS
ncbi:hypothetical protein HanIR_Chr11g0528861 [Helianthus annuus]|nr:hypothetical protein HanIR_Chr11g0528861 [Helianthus annuus]